MPKLDLDSAYALTSVDDTRQLYADWAETYDSDFAEQMDFVVPGIVADAFAKAGGSGPVLDFGCGTGLVGQYLAKHDVNPVDGADLSPEMLAVARRKQVYRHLIEGDILDGLTIPDNFYSAVVSSGTFTHGHVGPDALDELLRIAAPGALFAVSINGQHFVDAGFAAKFDTMVDRITELRLSEVRFYGDNATGPHKDDTGKIALFRKT